MKYDSTGMFHWSPAKNLEECILVRYFDFFYSIQIQSVAKTILYIQILSFRIAIKQQ